MICYDGPWPLVRLFSEQYVSKNSKLELNGCNKANYTALAEPQTDF